MIDFQTIVINHSWSGLRRQGISEIGGIVWISDSESKNWKSDNNILLLHHMEIFNKEESFFKKLHLLTTMTHWPHGYPIGFMSCTKPDSSWLGKNPYRHDDKSSKLMLIRHHHFGLIILKGSSSSQKIRYQELCKNRPFYSHIWTINYGDLNESIKVVM